MTGSERSDSDRPGQPARPAARRLAGELGVDIGSVTPTGPSGQVTTADVRQAAAAAARASWRRAQAPRLAAAAAVPAVTSVDRADFEQVLDAGVAPLTAVARACVAALGAHPRLNAWLGDRETPWQHAAVHLGVVTQAAAGQVVPVVRDADRLNAVELAAAIAQVTAAARGNRALASDLEGSTFTLTDQIGGLLGTPPLNPPEVAALGLHRIEPRPVVRDGAVAVRRTGNLSLTVDRRAVDEGEAAAFLGAVVRLVESWPQST